MATNRVLNDKYWTVLDSLNGKTLVHCVFDNVDVVRSGLRCGSG